MPSFSSNFSGAETMVGGELFGIIKLSRFQYAAETGIGCKCHPYEVARALRGLAAQRTCRAQSHPQIPSTPAWHFKMDMPPRWIAAPKPSETPPLQTKTMTLASLLQQWAGLDGGPCSLPFVLIARVDNSGMGTRFVVADWQWEVGTRASSLVLAPPEGEMPKIKGPFWVVLVFVYSKGAVVRT